MKKIIHVFFFVLFLFVLVSCLDYTSIEDPTIIDPTENPTIIDPTIIDPTVDPSTPFVDPTIVPSDPTEVIPSTYKFVLNPGNDTVEINTTWLDRGAYLDLETENIEVAGNHQVDTKTLGTYQVTYEISYNEVIYRLSRIVIVVDQTPPKLTLNPGIDTIKVGETWVDGYVTVTDNSLGEVTIVVTGVVNTLQIGQYQIIYIATDSSGNTSQITRIVTVYQ
jgi:hypothetical protein